MSIAFEKLGRCWQTGALIVCALVAGSAAAAELPAGDAVMGRLSAVFRDMQDLSADVEIHTGAKQASGRIVLQYAKETQGGDEKTVRKYVIETRMPTADGTARVKQVNDGTVLWVERTLVETGEVKVTRRRVDAEGPVPGGFGPDWRKEMDSWRQKYDFKTLREDTFDGEKVTVVEGIRKIEPKEGTVPDSGTAPKPDLSAPDRIVLFVAHRDDFVRKADLYLRVAAKKPDGTETTREALAVSVRLTHVKLNKGLPNDTFDYQIPEGAEFTDVK